jgi:hypothetical protein
MWATLVTAQIDPASPTPTPPSPDPTPTPTPVPPAPVAVAGWLDDDDPVLDQRKKLANYAAAKSIDAVTHFVQTQGPICWGIGWTDSMFTPDANGLVVPSGPDVGGHAIIEYGYDPTNDEHLLLNHWGASWGVKGRFRMRGSDLAERLANGGEAWAAVEVAA